MARSATRRTNASPPRGTMRSTYRSSVIRTSTASRSATSMNPIASGGSPAFSSPLARIAAMTAFDSRPPAAAEDARVPALHAERRGVGGHVRAALVDEPDDARAARGPARSRSRSAAASPGRSRRRDRAARRPGGSPAAMALDARVRERQAVEEGPRMPLPARPLEVRAVRLEDGGRLLLEAARHGEEGLALHARVGERQGPGGLARGPGARLDQLAHVDRRHGPRVSRGQRMTRLSRWMTSSVTR